MKEILSSFAICSYGKKHGAIPNPNSVFVFGLIKKKGSNCILFVLTLSFDKLIFSKFPA